MPLPCFHMGVRQKVAFFEKRARFFLVLPHADLARESGVTPVAVSEAAHSGDVVIVTIPEKNIPHLPADLFAGVPESVVVVDTGNYYPQQRDAASTESKLARPRADGLRNSWVDTWSRHSTTSMRNISWISANLPVHRGESPYPLLATTRPLRQWCFVCWTSLDLMESMQVDLMIPGVSNQVRRSTPRTLMWQV